MTLGERAFGLKNEDEIEAGYRAKYIEYISRLLERMDIRSLERMLDAAIDEIR